MICILCINSVHFNVEVLPKLANILNMAHVAASYTQLLTSANTVQTIGMLVVCYCPKVNLYTGCPAIGYLLFCQPTFGNLHFAIK